VRIVVDRELCQGHAMCEVEAPEIFSVPKVGTVEVLFESLPTGHLEAVQLAVQYCPTHALSLKED
jgi:ferredoxin